MSVRHYTTIGQRYKFLNQDTKFALDYGNKISLRKVSIKNIKQENNKGSIEPVLISNWVERVISRSDSFTSEYYYFPKTFALFLEVFWAHWDN